MKQIEVTNGDVLALNQILDAAAKNQGKSEDIFKFYYSCNRTREKLQEQVKAIENSNVKSEGYLKFENEKKSLLEKHCNKNENGSLKTTQINPTMVQYDITNADGKVKQEYLDDIKILEGKYKDELTEQTEKETKYFQHLNEKTSIEIYPIKLNLIPKPYYNETKKLDIEGLNPEIYNYFDKLGLIEV